MVWAQTPCLARTHGEAFLLEEARVLEERRRCRVKRR